MAAAEYAVLAAAARAGVAAAELFPQLVLTGGVGLQAVGVGNVSNRGLRFGLGVGVTLPFLEWNRIRQRILAADATAEIALADYERTVLSALEEAERAITAYVQERERFVIWIWRLGRRAPPPISPGSDFSSAPTTS